MHNIKNNTWNILEYIFCITYNNKLKYKFQSIKNKSWKTLDQIFCFWLYFVSAIQFHISLEWLLLQQFDRYFENATSCSLKYIVPMEHMIIWLLAAILQIRAISSLWHMCNNIGINLYKKSVKDFLIKIIFR